MLWREWHRNRPSRLARLVSTLFMGCTVTGTAVGIIDSVRHGTGLGDNLLVITSFIAVSFGLLLLSATAPTTLTEERVRGSLDILMSTPLSTHQIVLGKWWATYRRTLPMLVLPALAGLFVAATCLDYPVWLPPRMMSMAKPVTTVDRVMAGILPSAFFLAHSAAVTSFGLALATWLKRHRAGRGRERYGFRRDVFRMDHCRRVGAASALELVAVATRRVQRRDQRTDSIADRTQPRWWTGGSVGDALARVGPRARAEVEVHAD